MRISEINVENGYPLQTDDPQTLFVFPDSTSEKRELMAEM